MFFSLSRLGWVRFCAVPECPCDWGGLPGFGGTAAPYQVRSFREGCPYAASQPTIGRPPSASRAPAVRRPCAECRAPTNWLVSENRIGYFSIPDVALNLCVHKYIFLIAYRFIITFDCVNLVFDITINIFHCSLIINILGFFAFGLFKSVFWYFWFLIKNSFS